MAGEPDPIDRRASARAAGVVERARPSRRLFAACAHAVDADQRDDAAQGQHRPVAGDLRSLHAARCCPPSAARRTAPCRAANDAAISSVRSLSIAVIALHAHRQPGQRRQVADGAQAVEQQRQRPAFVVGRRLEPAVERAEEGARIAVALARLRRRCRG